MWSSRRPHGRALDFGCGSGVMLPFLSGMCAEVVAADVDLLPLERMKRHIPLAPQRHGVGCSPAPTIAQAAAASFDLIIALDVLEHVKDLSSTADTASAPAETGRATDRLGPHRERPVSLRPHARRS